VGIIYEKMRKDKEFGKIWNIEETDNFIYFYSFIDLLKLYSDDSTEMIVDYLINDDEFLKLDFYRLIEIAVDKNGVEANEGSLYESYDNYRKDFSFTKLEYIQLSYDAYGDDDPIDYPTEYFLEQCLGYEIDDRFNDKNWKIEDILSLDCIVNLGLDTVAFEECYKALNSDPSMILNYIREREEFKERLIAEQVRNSKMQKIDPNIYDITVEQLAKKEGEIKGLLNKIEHLEQDAIADNDKTMHPRTANTVSKIIAAIASELLNMDLTQPFANDSNGKIMAAIEKQGNTVSKDVIAHWLKLAHENSI